MISSQRIKGNLKPHIFSTYREKRNDIEQIDNQSCLANKLLNLLNKITMRFL
jgi:hypothetical protein